MNLLTRLGSYDSTDPKDQLYAFLGLSQEADNPSLTPAYDETLRNTLCRYGKFFSTQDNCIQMLYDFRCGHTIPDLPPWILNWTAPLNTDNSRIPWLAYVERVDGASLTHPGVYRASGDSRASMYAADDAISQLSVEGVIVDDIFHVGSVFITPEEVAKTDLSKFKQDRLLLDFYNEIDQIATLRHVHIQEGQSLEEAKWRTLKNDCSAYDAAELQVCLWKHRREKEALQNKDVVELGKLLQQAIERASEARMGTWQVYRNQYYDSKKLCLTNRGYLGQVPHSARIGDKVCIFLGSAVPHVLRQVDGGFYHLLGTAYMHGIMQGEAMEGESVEIRKLTLV